MFFKRSLILAAVFFTVFQLTAQSDEIRHRFIVVDNGLSRLVHVDQTGNTAGWSIDLPAGSRGLCRVDAESVLVACSDGGLLVNINNGEVLRRIQPDFGRLKVNIQSIQPAGDGGWIAASRGSGKVAFLKLDSDWNFAGKLHELKKLPEGGRLGGDPGLRTIKATADGTFMISSILRKPGKWHYSVAEISFENGFEVKQMLPIEGKGYAVYKLPDGTIAATTGESCTVQFLDSDGNTVARMGGEEHLAAGLEWFSGFELLSNGNALIANWLGHGREGKGPHLFEFTPDNRLVWSWEDHDAVQRATNVLVLE